jgi:cellulose synthase/poly-beta-1,6-N-acetylglucosamine synthase-like glycosyltransferase
MIIETLIIITLIMAAIPCGLFFLNLLVYRPLPTTPAPGLSDNPPRAPELSVLIPARNEEVNIRDALGCVLANPGNFEVIVLDDHSTDRTADVVRQASARDRRVRLLQAPELPKGWCGKMHAANVLGAEASGQWLLFLDADVRLSCDALSRMLAFMKSTGTALASGVPRQEVGAFLEKLLIPLIHFVLLAFLPMHIMLRSRWKAFGAGCGQLIIVHRDAYQAAGGHAAIKTSRHDGVKLPRAFRAAGFATLLFDATDVAACRMYQTNEQVWLGLGKNATEGIGAPASIVPMSALLFGGQVLPFLLLPAAPGLSAGSLLCLLGACFFSLAPRLWSARKFHQPSLGAWLHPFAILALLWIQWSALFRELRGVPESWKGRTYAPETIKPSLAAVPRSSGISWRPASNKAQ